MSGFNTTAALQTITNGLLKEIDAGCRQGSSEGSLNRLADSFSCVFVLGQNCRSRFTDTITAIKPD